MKPLFEMSEAQRRKEEIRLAREERLEELKICYRQIHPNQTEAYYKRMAARRLAWEELQF